MSFCRYSLLASVILSAALAVAQQSVSSQPDLRHRSASILTVDGLHFKDLNRNGKLDPYEDWRLSPLRRAEDLVAHMTLAEKAGLMMHGTIVLGNGGAPNSEYDRIAMEKMILQTHVNSFITRLGGDASHLADQNNMLQEIAERDRLGIPATISTDPRNHFQYTQGASVERGSFSQWPESLGLAALRDASAIRRFADIARQEYLAVGITEALSPQADLATEPRWARINGTFGEDADLASESVEAYIEGFQNGRTGIHPGSVIAVVKHWTGYGAQVDGWDSHNPYGRFAAYPGNNFAYHSILQGVTIHGKPVEPIGANYSRVLLTDLLRGDYHFQGVILTDWGITQDCLNYCLTGTPPGVPATWNGVGMDWGAEKMSKEERFTTALQAGVDQFGGTEEAQWVVAAVEHRNISEARINESVTRILQQKFAQGLFENPYVDPKAAARIVGSHPFQQAADQAQRRSMVLLQNRNGILPIRTAGKKVFLVHIDPSVALHHGFQVVDSVEKADFAIVRTNTPFQVLHPGYAMGHMQHEGDLDFKADNPDFLAIQHTAAQVPTIVTIYLDRPAILTNVVDKTAALLGNFGVSDEALFDVISGKDQPQGKLPFELPSTMSEVLAQKSDVPHDTAHPLFPYGFGLSF
jgi:beta-glucosidase